MFRINLFRRVSGGTGGVVASILAVAFVAVGATGALAAPPTVDGNINDLLTYAESEADCGLVIEDAAQDVCKTDAGIVPCVAEIPCPLGGGGTYFVNGFDFTHSVAAYDAVGQDLYLGFRVVGNIGDANGDGDPGNVCAVPGANVTDGAQISLQEQYTWELDTNCDGTPDILVEVRGDAVSVTGAAHGGATHAFNGTDLEVRVNDIVLPAIWRLRPFVGSTTDGLSEDTAPPAECPPPALDLEIDKSATPTEICVSTNPTTRFTITVENTGSAALLVSLTDLLPAGLSYAANVSGNFTVNNVVGQLITFNDLTIPAGASRSVNFDANATSGCFGEVTNVATATGSYDEACLEDPIGVGPVQAEFPVVCVCPEGDNCPRTPGYWTQQCKAVPGVAPKGNVKYWYDEVVAIAGCVDAASDWFNWGDDFAGFCSTVDPERPMNPFKQLQRHYAVLLANYCTGQLGIIANNGAEVNLSLGTEIDCGIDGVDTIQDLVDAIEDALANGDDHLYGQLLECADAINNGIGIPTDPDCGEGTQNHDREAELDLSSFRLERPAPNPFQGKTTVRYTISDATASVSVRLGIYDVAGRLVKTLVGETQGPGQYQVHWDGTDQGGAKVNRGIYFVRGTADGQNLGSPARVVFLR